MNKLITPFLILFISTHLNAQVGGSVTYNFLNLPSSSRIAGVGGIFTSGYDEDVNLVFQNPAALNNQMNNCLSLNRVAYLADADYAFAGYAHQFKSLGSLAIGIQYLNYGDFLETNLIGEVVGKFSANEQSVQIVYARNQNEKLSYGFNLKLASSRLATYFSSAICVDAGLLYHDSSSGFNASAVIKNIGTQLTGYTSVKEKLPFDIEAGVSKKLEHTPFQISLNLHHLQQFNIRYDDPAISNTASILGDTSTPKEKKYFADKIFRHAVFGTQIFLGRNLNLSIGYNHIRRQELGFAQRKGMGGFSFGAAIKVKRFQLGYSHANYDIAGGTDNFSLLINLQSMFGKHELN